MSKKNKDIEVNVEEANATVDGKDVTVLKLSIGKNEIGTLTPKEKGFLAELPEGTSQLVKSEDEGYDYIIRNWNLHE